MIRRTLRSHTSSAPLPGSGPDSSSSHTLNRPPVSGAVSGIRAMRLIMGVGKVRKSSVWTQVARGALFLSAHQLYSSLDFQLSSVSLDTRQPAKLRYGGTWDVPPTSVAEFDGQAGIGRLRERHGFCTDWRIWMGWC